MKSKEALLALGITALPIAAVTYRLFGHPSMKKYQHLYIRPGASLGADMVITFMGVTTMLFDDGKTRLLSDGYYSRPRKFPAFLGSIGPDLGRIAAALSRAQIANLDAVFVSHSHFDHVLDSPVVAKLTGAELIGSESTEQVARGYNFPMDKFRRVQGGSSLEYGDFKLTIYEAPHSPHPISPGEITEPVAPTADHSAFRLGRNFNFLIEHRGSAYLLQQSANFTRGLYKNVRADLVFLGIGALGKQPDEFIEEYWREVVLMTGARKAILTHWDDFNIPVAGNLKPMPRLFDNFARSMGKLKELSKRDSVEILLPVAFQTFDPKTARCTSASASPLSTGEMFGPPVSHPPSFL